MLYDLKKKLICGLPFPAVAVILTLFCGGWKENFRFLRVCGCYLPIPFFFLLFFLTFVFLSFSFFVFEGANTRRCSDYAFNVKIFALTSAFLTEMWFYLAFSGASPTASLIVMIFSIVSSAFSLYFGFASGGITPVFSAAALVLQFVFLFMNFKVLFI